MGTWMGLHSLIAITLGLLNNVKHARYLKNIMLAYVESRFMYPDNA